MTITDQIEEYFMDHQIHDNVQIGVCEIVPDGKKFLEIMFRTLRDETIDPKRRMVNFELLKMYHNKCKVINEKDAKAND